MIRAVTVTNYLGESIRIDMFDPDPTGFIIKSIDGLGPAQANVNFTDFALIDGAIDNSARLETRNIVLELLFQENPTIEDTRLATYRYFPIKQNVTLTIETDRRTATTTGRVESNSPDIFSEQEGCQISILCPDPYFYSPSGLLATFSSVDPLFEFPFSNESTDEDLINFGEITVRNSADIYYSGDAETGFTMTIYCGADVSNLVIKNESSDTAMYIDDSKLEQITGSTLLAGDEVHIGTRRGNKYAYLMRYGKKQNIINALGRPVYWLSLVKGTNRITYNADVGLLNLQFSITSQVAYEGV